MSRWGKINKFVSSRIADVQKIQSATKLNDVASIMYTSLEEAYSTVMIKMVELDSLPVVEVEVPETVDGHCNMDCLLYNGGFCKKSVASYHPIQFLFSSDGKPLYSKPGPSCPRYKGEKG